MLSSIRTRFDERKTAAAAGVLLQEAGGRMEYLRLIKLLYLADRESWRQFNRPITGDEYVAMKYGPVLRQTFDLVKTEPEEGPWARTIEREGPFHLRLKAEPDLGPLSDAEIEILKGAHRLYSQVSQWKLNELTHPFPRVERPGQLLEPHLARGHPPGARKDGRGDRGGATGRPRAGALRQDPGCLSRSRSGRLFSSTPRQAAQGSGGGDGRWPEGEA